MHYHKSKPKEERSQTTDAVHDTKLKEEPRTGIETTTTSYVKKLSPQKIALRTIPVTFVNGNKRIKRNAFVDDGSTATYISEDVANYLGLKGEIDHLSLNVNGKHNTGYLKGKFVH